MWEFMQIYQILMFSLKSWITVQYKESDQIFVILILTQAVIWLNAVKKFSALLTKADEVCVEHLEVNGHPSQAVNQTVVGSVIGS